MRSEFLEARRDDPRWVAIYERLKEERLATGQYNVTSLGYALLIQTNKEFVRLYGAPGEESRRSEPSAPLPAAPMAAAPGYTVISLEERAGWGWAKDKMIRSVGAGLFTGSRGAPSEHAIPVGLRGGTIVFPTDPEAQGAPHFAARIEAFARSWIERFQESRNRFLNAMEAQARTAIPPEWQHVQGFTVGNFFRGRYLDDEGRLYDKASLGVDVILVNPITFGAFAADATRTLNQRSALVRNHALKAVYFIERTVHQGL